MMDRSVLGVGMVGEDWFKVVESGAIMVSEAVKVSGPTEVEMALDDDSGCGLIWEEGK
jgi:hypothetical protein